MNKSRNHHPYPSHVTDSLVKQAVNLRQDLNSRIDYGLRPDDIFKTMQMHFKVLKSTPPKERNVLSLQNHKWNWKALKKLPRIILMGLPSSKVHSKAQSMCNIDYPDASLMVGQKLVMLQFVV